MKEFVTKTFLMSISNFTAPNLDIAWGFASSAYQIEGAWKEDGRGVSVWDKWSLDPAHSSLDNAFQAIDHYHRMESDLVYLKRLGASMYRFSVSWPRILPNCTGEVNPKGIEFYSRMIDEIIKNGAEPMLTMYHWDIPQVCHDRYGSFNGSQIVPDFTRYADVLFEHFGDRVKYYLTMNEMTTECNYAYSQDMWPPALNGGEIGKYTCLHNVNLVHGSVVQLARSKYASKGFKISMPLPLSWGEPANASDPLDVAASERMMDMMMYPLFGPLTGGDYPQLLKNDPAIAPYLPTFTAEQKKMVNGTLDFIAMNYYTAARIKNAPGKFPGEWDTATGYPPLGPTAESSWLVTYAPGLRGMIKFFHKRFNLDIYVTECGVSAPGEATKNAAGIMNDEFRVQFFRNHTEQLVLAIKEDKIPVKAFLVWSLFDNFEWGHYNERFGVIGVDFNGTNTGVPFLRMIKNSATFVSEFFKNAKSPL